MLKKGLSFCSWGATVAEELASRKNAFVAYYVMGGKVTILKMYSLTRVWYIEVFIPLFTYLKYEIQAHVTRNDH